MRGYLALRLLTKARGGDHARSRITREERAWPLASHRIESPRSLRRFKDDRASLGSCRQQWLADDLSVDEGTARTSARALAQLKPAFNVTGTVTPETRRRQRRRRSRGSHSAERSRALGSPRRGSWRSLLHWWNRRLGIARTVRKVLEDAGLTLDKSISSSERSVPAQHSLLARLAIVRPVSMSRRCHCARHPPRLPGAK